MKYECAIYIKKQNKTTKEKKDQKTLIFKKPLSQLEQASVTLSPAVQNSGHL